ncbi:unnamed protein product [Arctia plantaginis]|uniref:C2H2-type domain-containing protein n=1 Tax=Arctia plantaginis TaxID=874455 RepID=A0A8S1B542_ARCPL|nr:unnamed protein product [Arctia plantaginis]
MALSCCLICNTRVVSSLRNIYNIFDENAISFSKDEVPTPTSLQSGKKLSEVVSDIVGITLEENKVHSNIICKKCHKSCMEYDMIHTRLTNLKGEILDQFKNSINSHNLDYENYKKSVITKNNIAAASIQKQPVILSKKLVLPASKLQPIPPDLLLKVGKLPAFSKGNIVLPQIQNGNASTLNLKVTVGTSVLTQTIKTTTTTNAAVKQTANLLTTLTNDIEHMVTSQSHTSPKTSILNFNVNSLPNNFLSEAMLTRNDDEDNSEDVKSNGDDKGTDGQSMEIDGDYSISLVPVSNADNNNLVLEVEGVKSSSKVSSEVEEFLNVEELHSLDSTNEEHKYILGKLEILNGGEDEIDEDEEAHTIVVDSENGSILRMVSGQKFMYEGGEISLVMTEDDQQQDEANELNEEQGDDSNDETAIELQMAGDEETANAIIAAAQEQGGALIKVESGEMFRVHSVEPRHEPSPHQPPPHQLVRRQGDGFQCLLCEANNEGEAEEEKRSVSGDAEWMMRHVKRSHDARVYICQFCSAIMRRKVDYTAHMVEHASSLKGGRGVGAASHTCALCNKTFGSRALLLEHANVHAGLRPHACALCHKAFANKYTYQAHVKTHAIRPRPHKCNQCGKSFLTQQHLIQHEKTHSGIKDFICNICNKAFSTQHNLEVHGVVHSGNKSFVCNVCSKAFARRAELRDHMRTHTGERPFPCDICGARFTQRSNLHSHRRATHLDDKRHSCTLCPKRFKRRRLLEYHIKASHTGERPLKCKVCGASFVYPEHYKKHIRIHSGDRPYVCEICGKSFNSADNRNTHRFVHSDKKPYECVACGAGYMRKQLLYAHMNTSGHLAESIVVNQPRVIKVSENNPSASGANETSESQSLNKFDTIFASSELDTSVKSVSFVKTEELQDTKLICNIISDDKKLILQDPEKTTLSLLQENEDPTLLTIHNLGDRSQNAILEAVSAEQLSDQTEIVANDENGGVVRLIQIKLPDGNNGWVALNR